MDKSRLEAFSDGVFSISITLLVLDVRIPDVNIERNEQLLKAIEKALPNILTFIFTFLVVGVFWVAHHRIFALVKRVNGALLWINIIYLLLAALVPFPASILAKHPFLPSAILMYTGLLLCIGLMHFAFLYYLKRNESTLSIPITPTLMSSLGKVAAFGPCCYLLSAVFSFMNVGISFFFILLPLIFYIFFANKVAEKGLVSSKLAAKGSSHEIADGF